MGRKNGRRSDRDETPGRDLVRPAGEAEVLVLAALLNGHEASDMVLDRLATYDFAAERHRRIYATCLLVRENGGDVGIPAVIDEFGADVEHAGGLEYLAEILEAAPPRGISLEPYVHSLLERSAARQILEACQGAERLAAEHGYARARALLDERISRIEAAVGTGESSYVLSLGEFLADPDRSKPPQVEVPRLAWAGRLSLFAGREKGGKSTVVSHAVAEKTRGGWFLGESMEPGSVLWVGLDEPMSDTANRLDAFGADRGRTLLLDRVDSLDGLARVAAQYQPTVLVIDSLYALADVLPEPPESGDAAGWTRVMKQISVPCRTVNAAVLVIHHGRKQDGAARDSTAITANADMVLEMSEQDGEQDVRKIKARGRWQVEAFSIRMAGERFVLEAGDLSVDARVLLFVESHPGCSVRAVTDGVRGRTMEVNSAVKRLLSRGAIEDHGNGRSACELHAAGPVGKSVDNDGSSTTGNGPGNGEIWPTMGNARETPRETL